MQPILHPLTEEQLSGFLASPSHALLLVGPAGSGKGTIATYIGSELLGLASDTLEDYAYYAGVRGDDKSISIESIRKLQEFTRLKTPGTNSVRRIIVIENASTMTTEAQNAFLKLLEEPPEDTVIIMTSETNRGLLPTVVSRTQKITVHPPSQGQLIAYFEKQGHKPSDIQRMQYISGGQIGLMYALLDSEQGHPLITGIDQAKQLLSKALYERLIEVDSIVKDKEQLQSIMDGLFRVSAAGFKQAIDANKITEARRWQNNLKNIMFSQRALHANGQPKLVLTNLLLNI